VGVQYRVGDKDLEVVIEDQGPGFDPGSVPDPTLDENLENPSGRGMTLMRAYMTEVRYEGRGNRLRMRYKRPAPKP
jgi:serine/threonine-protein kinase RsbW